MAASTEQDALKAAVFQRLHPRVYLERFVAEGIRPDGRPIDAWRDVSANVGTFGYFPYLYFTLSSGRLYIYRERVCPCSYR